MVNAMHSCNQNSISNLFYNLSVAQTLPLNSQENALNYIINFLFNHFDFLLLSVLIIYIIVFIHDKSRCTDQQKQSRGLAMFYFVS